MDLLPYIALLPARRPFQATDVEVAIFRTGAPMADPVEVSAELARLVDVETLVTWELTMHWGIAKSPLDTMTFTLFWATEAGELELETLRPEG